MQFNEQKKFVTPKKLYVSKYFRGFWGAMPGKKAAFCKVPLK